MNHPDPDMRSYGGEERRGLTDFERLGDALRDFSRALDEAGLWRLPRYLVQRLDVLLRRRRRP